MPSSIPSSSMSAAHVAALTSSRYLLLFIITFALPTPAVCLMQPSMHAEPQPDPAAHVRMDPSQSVTMLTRHSFNATVKQDHVDQWIVLFCVDWYEVCQGLWHDYRRMALHWEQAMAPNASSWQTTAVRFAEVDCAVDKALCNENKVQGYPSVTHFQGGEFAGEWEISSGATSLSGDLSKWIDEALTRKLANNKKGQASPRLDTGAQGRFGAVGLAFGELVGLLSWQDPATAAFGHFVLAVALGIVVWILGTGLELELKTVLCFGKQAKGKQWPSAWLPDLPETPAPRTIMRTSIVL